jgi:hypothetical protein
MRVLIIITLLFSSSSWAANDFKSYTVGQEDSFLEVSLPVNKVVTFQSGLLKMAKNIGPCNESKGTFTNPLIARDSNYTITKSRAGCNVRFNSHGAWQYTCALPPSERIKLAGYIKKRAQTDEALGDFSAGEKQVLFYSGFCEKKRVN